MPTWVHRFGRECLGRATLVGVLLLGAVLAPFMPRMVAKTLLKWDMDGRG